MVVSQLMISFPSSVELQCAPPGGAVQRCRRLDGPLVRREVLPAIPCKISSTHYEHARPPHSDARARWNRETAAHPLRAGRTAWLRAGAGLSGLWSPSVNALY